MSGLLDGDMGKEGFARHLFRLRFRDLRMSQKAFAIRFGLTASQVEDIEQGRRQPSRAMRVLVEMIARDPDSVAAAVTLAFQCDCGNGNYDGCCAVADPE